VPSMATAGETNVLIGKRATSRAAELLDVFSSTDRFTGRGSR
jgi:hypothetical protein